MVLCTVGHLLLLALVGAARAQEAGLLAAHSVVASGPHLLGDGLLHLDPLLTG